MAIGPAVGFLELLIFMMFGVGSGIPLGVPPGPHDPYLFSVAPDKCLYYTAWAGMAAPDPGSDNSTEQIMGEPEVQQFVIEAEKQIRGWLAQAAPRNAEVHLDLFKQVVTHPAAIFVEQVQPAANGIALDAALILSLGEDVNAFRDIVGVIEDTLGDLPTERVQIDGNPFMTAKVPDTGMSVTWGVKGQYFLLALGEQTIQGILDREQTPVPAWLKELLSQTDVDRPATYTYADLNALIMLSAMAGGEQAQGMIAALGFNAISKYTSVAGLDEKGFVSRTKVGVDGEPAGILKVLKTEGLDKADVAGIPGDALVAAAVRFDASKIIDGWLEIVGEIDPASVDYAEVWIQQMEQALGIKIREGVLESLGDVWSLHTSPRSGGLVTGWTLMVTLDKPQQAQELHARLLGFVHGMMMRDPDGVRVKTFKFRDTDIFTLEVPTEEFFVAPSWCITDKHLMLGLMPQTIKSQLAREADDSSILDRPAVAALFTDERTPAAFFFQDTRSLFETLYPPALMGIQAATSEVRRRGIQVDISCLPSVAAIAPHLAPSVSAVFPSDDGIEAVSRQSVPGGNFGAMMPVSVAMLLPAVQSARGAARRSQSMNQLRQLGLAMHNYHDVTKAFPPAANVDEDGKPLLSWRVHVLPFLEQQALYEQFHLDEPWDSEHNRKLIASMPDVFKAPQSRAEPGKTVYLGNASREGIFALPKENQRGQAKWPTGVRLRDIRDGTSNTIMIVEANDASAVIWTKPSDFEPDKDNPFAGLIGLRPEGCLSVFCDGAIHTLPPTLDKRTMWGLFTRAGGEIVELR